MENKTVKLFSILAYFSYIFFEIDENYNINLIFTLTKLKHLFIQLIKYIFMSILDIEGMVALENENMQFENEFLEEDYTELSLNLDDSNNKSNVVYQGIHFQDFDIATKDSYADFGLNALPKLTQVNTLCHVINFK